MYSIYIQMFTITKLLLFKKKLLSNFHYVSISLLSDTYHTILIQISFQFLFAS